MNRLVRTSDCSYFANQSCLKRRAFCKSALVSLLAFLVLSLNVVPVSAVDAAIQGRSIVDTSTGDPLRGFYAVWQGIPNDPVAIGAKMDAMINNFGLKGFTFEIGWDVAEPSQGSFHWSPTWDTLFDLAHEKGLKVNVVLTAHYTPDWVYNQPGIDVHMKDPNGNNAVGHQLNYSPSSPAALQWQGDFQRTVLEHYKDKPALLSVHLTNEVSYGRSEGSWTDYSSWANEAWDDWLTARGLPIVSMPKPTEANSRPTDWRNWTLYRQDQLNNYFNTSYENAASALGPNDHVLISQREYWYGASEAFATKHGLLYDPNLYRPGDILGGNNYGTNEVMAAMMVSSGMPIFTTETSLHDLGNGIAVPPGSVNQVMLRQFFQGAENQTVYQFSAASYFPMRMDDDTPHPSFAQFKSMTQIVDRIQEAQLDFSRQVGYLWPRNYAAVNADQYQNVQQLMNTVMLNGRHVAQSPVMVYPSFFESGQPSAGMLSDLKLIYATRNYGMDQATLNSPGLRDWVAAGGVLFVELSQGMAPPSWSGVTASATSFFTSSTFDTLPISPFGAISNISTSGTKWQLNGLTQSWATWDLIFGSAQQSAAGVKEYGQGKVVLVGANSLGSFNTAPGMNNYVFGNEQLNQSWRYYRLGHNVLVEPGQQSTGLVYIPLAWLGDSLEAWMMDMTSGVFMQTNWLSVDNDRYVFEVPANHILLAITMVPEPATAGMMITCCVAGALVYARRRRKPFFPFTR